jgi:hypothetical protein
MVLGGGNLLLVDKLHTVFGGRTGAKVGSAMWDDGKVIRKKNRQMIQGDSRVPVSTSTDSLEASEQCWQV